MSNPNENRPPVAGKAALIKPSHTGNNTSLDHALQYAKQGFAVFPVSEKGKTPACPHGFKDASTDPEKIKNLWCNRDNLNIGVATGTASGCFVLDIDGEEGETSLAALEMSNAPLPKTLTSITGQGRHLLFRLPEGETVSTSASKLGRKLDVRGEGGYIVAPPSTHPNGSRYRWQDVEMPIAFPPQWLIALICPAPMPPAARPQVRAYSLKEVQEMLAKIEPDCVYDDWIKVGMALHEGGWPLSVWEDWSSSGATYKAGECACKWQGFGKPQRTKNRVTMGTLAHIAHAYEVGQKSGGILGCSVTCLADIKAEPISWLWTDHFALGKITVLAGDPGLGKSQSTASFAASDTTGKAWPDESSPQETGAVVILNAEDDAADTIKPRLVAAGADVSRCYVIDAVRTEDKNGRSGTRGFNLAEDVEALDNFLKNEPDVRLIIIDPVSAYLGKVDSNNNSEIRGVLAPLSAVATRYRVAVLLVTHLNKSTGQDTMARVIGSVGMVAAARAAYVLQKDEEGRRALLPLKNNIGNDHTGFYLTIEEAWIEDEKIKTSRVIWGGCVEKSDFSGSSSLNGNREADSFLRNLLCDKPLPAVIPPL